MRLPFFDADKEIRRTIQHGEAYFRGKKNLRKSIGIFNTQLALHHVTVKIKSRRCGGFKKPQF